MGPDKKMPVFFPVSSVNNLVRSPFSFKSYAPYPKNPLHRVTSLSCSLFKGFGSASALQATGGQLKHLPRSPGWRVPISGRLESRKWLRS
jgi:hypothetical protein